MGIVLLGKGLLNGEQGCGFRVGRVEPLTIDFSAMGYVEDFDISSRVIDGINNSIISDSDAVKIAVSEFLSAEWSWVDFQARITLAGFYLVNLEEVF